MYSVGKIYSQSVVGNLKRRCRKLKHTWQLACGLYSYEPSTAGLM